MARKKPKRPNAPSPKTDTRRRSQPSTAQERRDATQADLRSEVAAQRERIEMLGVLIRRWVRQAMAPGDKQVGLPFFIEEFENGFKLSQSVGNDKADEELLKVAWGDDTDTRPRVEVLSQRAKIIVKERDLDGKVKAPDVKPQPKPKPKPKR